MSIFANITIKKFLCLYTMSIAAQSSCSTDLPLKQNRFCCIETDCFVPVELQHLLNFTMQSLVRDRSKAMFFFLIIYCW